jgi:hypothetical protein
VNTDRELLELAAKAAGISIDKSPANGGGPDNTGFDLAGNLVTDWHNGTTWNPLADDGDALRLAVGLAVSVERRPFEPGSVFAHAAGACEGCIESLGDTQETGSAATRRAIVRAAAELSKQQSKNS